MGVDSYARDTLLSDTSHVSHNIIQYLIQISRQMFLNPMCDMMLGERERERWVNNMILKSYSFHRAKDSCIDS